MNRRLVSQGLAKFDRGRFISAYASTTLLAGHVQIEKQLPAGISFFTIHLKHSFSTYGDSPANICIWNDQYQKYFDKSHPPSSSSVNSCKTSSGDSRWPVQQIGLVDDYLKGSGRTFTTVEIAILKINGKPAPESCQTLAGYQYQSNADYIISISATGCHFSRH